MDYEAEHQALIAHIVRLRESDAEYARWALQNYLAIEDFPWPDLEAEVKAAWAAKTMKKEQSSEGIS